ncbi:hypothetical protein D3C78_1842060 [compost metagenome]
MIDAWSGLVPFLKVTLMVSRPLLALLDCMYSMSSTPLIACSSGEATVSAITSAEAPG